MRTQGCSAWPCRSACSRLLLGSVLVDGRAVDRGKVTDRFATQVVTDRAQPGGVGGVVVIDVDRQPANRGGEHLPLVRVALAGRVLLQRGGGDLGPGDAAGV